MRLSLEKIAAYTGGVFVGRVDERREATGITWDSRTVRAGDVYVALPGQRVDGHDFVQPALQAGAAGILVMREPDEQTRALACEAGAGIVLVDDTARALRDLSSGWRDLLRGKVVAITGSCGKTTTKNLVKAVLESGFSVVATEGNQNNELGVPRTLLNADLETQFVVVEMGMRGLGQLADLCSFVKPDFGLITNVGESHLELLGSRRNIARAKSELLCALPAKRGLAFVNAADEYALFVRDEAKLEERGVRTIFFDGGDREIPCVEDEGSAAGQDVLSAPYVRAEDIVLDEEGLPRFTLRAGGFDSDSAESASCALRLGGLHNVGNACAAAAVGCACGLSLASCAAALETVQPEAGRQQLLRTKTGCLLINDAYNANPASMEASLRTFEACDVSGKRIAVLGDMGELGDFAFEGHERIGKIAAGLSLDVLVCVGGLSRGMARAAIDAGMPQERVLLADSAEEAVDIVRPLLSDRDAVLVKASHSVGLERVVEGLVQ